MCVANVYRPPNCLSSSFNEVLKFLKDCIPELNDDSYQICIVGDFNFPMINWDFHSVTPGYTSDTNLSAHAFLNFMAEHFMNQYVRIPTRGDNILNFFVTNDDQLVTNVISDQTDLSDHNLVNISLSFNPSAPNCPRVNSFDKDCFRLLNF